MSWMPASADFQIPKECILRMLWTRENWKKSFGIRKNPAAGICSYSSANSSDLLKCGAADSRVVAGTSQTSTEGFSQPW